MNMNIPRLIAVSVSLLSSQSFYLGRRSQLEVGPAPPFQVIARNTKRNRLDVWHPLPSSPANNTVKIQYKREKSGAQSRSGSGKLEERRQRHEKSGGWLSSVLAILYSLLSPLLSSARSERAEERQSLVETGQVSRELFPPLPQ